MATAKKPAAKKTPVQPDPQFRMPVEVKEWIDQASSRLAYMTSEIERLKEENQKLKEMATGKDVVLSAEHVPGPIALICESVSKRIMKKAAGICARFSDAKNEKKLPVIYRLGKKNEEITPEAITQEKMDALRINSEAKVLKEDT